MAYVIAEPCVNTKDTACVEVCPVDCIHPKKDEADFAAATPLLSAPARAWLRDALALVHPGHPWGAALSSGKG